MLNVTLSTAEGQTVTTADPTTARNFVIDHADADPITAVIDGNRFFRLMFRGNWLEAGNVAEDLGLNFAISRYVFCETTREPEPIRADGRCSYCGSNGHGDAVARPVYTVPVDPADATNCEACQ